MNTKYKNQHCNLLLACAFATASVSFANMAQAESGNIPPDILKKHYSSGECFALDAEELAGFSSYMVPLSKNTSLYILPCDRGAYSSFHRAYLYHFTPGDPGFVEPVYFAEFSDELGWSGTPNLANAAVDENTKSFTSTNWARGLADCGGLTKYKWNGDALVMVEYRYQGSCDGTQNDPEQWPLIFEKKGE